mmetsp:Transcript_6417/g.15888  ORF Transcript_6417/g.15888 Transcript_6417/m.15888 type:complete len:117 (+) Transcript_6417:565-915(+)
MRRQLKSPASLKPLSKDKATKENFGCCVVLFAHSFLSCLLRCLILSADSNLQYQSFAQDTSPRRCESKPGSDPQYDVFGNSTVLLIEEFDDVLSGVLQRPVDTHKRCIREGANPGM